MTDWLSIDYNRMCDRARKNLDKIVAKEEIKMSNGKIVFFNYYPNLIDKEIKEDAQKEAKKAHRSQFLIITRNGNKAEVTEFKDNEFKNVAVFESVELAVDYGKMVDVMSMD